MQQALPRGAVHADDTIPGTVFFSSTSRTATQE
jgi:hypothetical protein